MTDYSRRRKNAKKMGSLLCKCSSNAAFASRSFYEAKSTADTTKDVKRFLKGDLKPQYSPHKEVSEGYGCVCRLSSGHSDYLDDRGSKHRQGRILAGVTSVQILPKEGYGEKV